MNQKFIEKEDIKIDYEIFGYGCDGFGNLAKFQEMLEKIGIKAIIFVDNDTGGKDLIANKIPEKAILSDYADIRQKGWHDCKGGNEEAEERQKIINDLTNRKPNGYKNIIDAIIYKEKDSFYFSYNKKGKGNYLYYDIDDNKKAQLKQKLESINEK